MSKSLNLTSKKKQETLYTIPKGYKPFLKDLKTKIRSSQIKAAVRVNSTLIELYWQIGKDISNMQKKEGWGARVIERLAKDLKDAFPGIQGFSRRNLFYMRKFSESYQDFEIVQQVAALIPWGHNMVLLDTVENQEHRLWYMQKTIENGWSRDVMTLWIKSDLHKREGRAITNFKTTLPSNQSDLANQTLKDPYLFDFLELQADHNEKEVEQGLVDHVQKFLMEAGEGFAFVGQQYPLEVSGKNFFIDLLLYNFKLRRFFVVEIKAKAFDPRDTGQINFYLSAVDDLLKHPDDQPTIGLILCKTKDNIIAEYALRNMNSPIGVAGYETKIAESLPKELKGSLPTIEEIEAELEKDAKYDNTN